MTWHSIEHSIDNLRHDCRGQCPRATPRPHRARQLRATGRAPFLKTEHAPTANADGLHRCKGTQTCRFFILPSGSAVAPRCSPPACSEQQKMAVLQPCRLAISPCRRFRGATGTAMSHILHFFYIPEHVDGESRRATSIRNVPLPVARRHLKVSRSMPTAKADGATTGSTGEHRKGSRTRSRL